MIPGTGGAAFPNKIQFSSSGSCANSDATITGGMTLRDYFAAAALTTAGNFSMEYANVKVVDEKTIAQLAYHIADAMLAAREVAP